MRKTLAKFAVEYSQILDENGVCDEKNKPKLTAAQIKEIYEAMVLGRVFDEVALKLQREGRIGTYASIRGQEAANVGSAFALQKQDWLFPAFREDAAMMLRGVEPSDLYTYWGGDERGLAFREGTNVFMIAIPVSTQILHAVGHAWAQKMKNSKVVTIVYFGDGATSKADFYEGLNFAGVFRIPCVFICQNNQWAISVPRERQTAAETLAQKAIAAGFEGIQVDGNDVFAIYAATLAAVEKARRGDGPTLIEAFTYRMGDHTTADDAKKYRSEKEVAEWEKKDPLKRLEVYARKRKLWDEKYEKTVWESARKRIEEAVKKYESTTAAPPEDIFKYMFAEMPARLQDQLRYVKEDVVK